jgi:hypothetical protein
MQKQIMYMAVVAVVAVGAGFYGGVQYEKSMAASAKQARGAASSVADNANGGNGAQGGQARRQGGGSGMGQGGGGFTTGDIITMDDKSITVKGRDGSSKIVYIAGSTMVGKTVAGTADDLSVGESVMVTGTASPDGSVAAQSIQIRPMAPMGQPQQ